MAQKIPIASSTSPMLITSRMTGIGSGMTSPKIPPRAMKPATVSVSSRKWKTSLTMSAWVKPAAKKAADQIGICPAFRSRASMLAPMPTARDLEPGDAPVARQPDEDEQVGADVGEADRDVRVDADLTAQAGHHAKGDREDEQPRPAQLQLTEAREAAARQGADDQRQEDGAKKHRPRPGRGEAPLPAPGARLAGTAGGASWAARPDDPAGGPGCRGRGGPGSARYPGRTGCR